MSTIEIEWMEDVHRCETCGSSYAEGARVFLDGVEWLSFIPVAHCFGGDSWTEEDVYRSVIDHLGHTIRTDRDAPPKTYFDDNLDAMWPNHIATDANEEREG